MGDNEALSHVVSTVFRVNSCDMSVNFSWCYLSKNYKCRSFRHQKCPTIILIIAVLMLLAFGCPVLRVRRIYVNVLMVHNCIARGLLVKGACTRTERLSVEPKS